jgi:hypothetical protein
VKLTFSSSLHFSFISSKSFVVSIFSLMTQSHKKEEKSQKYNHSHTYHQRPWKHIGIWPWPLLFKVCCHKFVESSHDQPPVPHSGSMSSLHGAKGAMDGATAWLGHKRQQRTLEPEHPPANRAGQSAEVYEGRGGKHTIPIHRPQPSGAELWPMWSFH